MGVRRIKCETCGYVYPESQDCTQCEENKKTIKGYINVPKDGFKLKSTTIYFRLEDAEAVALDKKRIREIELFYVEVEDDHR